MTATARARRGARGAPRALDDVAPTAGAGDLPGRRACRRRRAGSDSLRGRGRPHRRSGHSLEPGTRARPAACGGLPSPRPPPPTTASLRHRRASSLHAARRHRRASAGPETLLHIRVGERWWRAARYAVARRSSRALRRRLVDGLAATWSAPDRLRAATAPPGALAGLPPRRAATPAPPLRPNAVDALVQSERLAGGSDA